MWRLLVSTGLLVGKDLCVSTGKGHQMNDDVEVVEEKGGDKGAKRRRRRRRSLLFRIVYA